MPPPDAGPLGDPLVRGLHDLGEVVVGDLGRFGLGRTRQREDEWRREGGSMDDVNTYEQHLVLIVYVFSFCFCFFYKVDGTCLFYPL